MIWIPLGDSGLVTFDVVSVEANLNTLHNVCKCDSDVKYSRVLIRLTEVNSLQAYISYEEVNVL